MIYVFLFNSLSVTLHVVYCYSSSRFRAPVSLVLTLDIFYFYVQSHNPLLHFKFLFF